MVKKQLIIHNNRITHTLWNDSIFSLLTLFFLIDSNFSSQFENRTWGIVKKKKIRLERKRMHLN